MTATSGSFARPFEFDPARWTHMLDKLVEHRPWFDDTTWADPEGRRLACSNYMVNALMKGAVWEVFKNAELTGVIVLNDLTLDTDANAHFVFFDRSLADKQALCLNVMARVFDPDGPLRLETIRIEIPTYAEVLAKWARVKLGFRPEALPLLDDLPPKLARVVTPRDDEDEGIVKWRGALRRELEQLLTNASTRRRVVIYKNRWHDAMLLRLHREEFYEHYELFQAKHAEVRGVDGSDAGGGKATAGDVQEHARELWSDSRGSGEHSAAGDNERLWEPAEDSGPEHGIQRGFPESG